ncbi:MAG: Ldh family oxidoreductase, partial [Planctomycetota bacterium]|nr:Ldh family oxidoreductase [Planctomycetota bacterium]
TNTVPAVALAGTLSRSVGNNVVAIACPGRDFPWVFDGCLGSVSWGKLREAKAAGRSIPEGLVADRLGNPVSDPTVALEEGIVLPIGGHKGSGLALFVDVLTAVLAGGRFSGQIEWIASGLARPHQYSHTFAALDIKRFRPLPEVQGHLDDISRFLQAQPKDAHGGEARVPGERQALEEKRRREEGIPLDVRTFETLATWAGRLGVPMPGLRSRPKTSRNTKSAEP